MERRKAKIFTVDSFTKTPFSGNPAGVCLVSKEEKLSEETMQKIAFEMNLSETAFVCKRNAKGEYDLRWFTPSVEVPLCGHGKQKKILPVFCCFFFTCEFIPNKYNLNKSNPGQRVDSFH